MLKNYDEMKEEIKNHKKLLGLLKLLKKKKRKTNSKNSNLLKTKNGEIIVISNCVVSKSKKSRFIKEQEASGLLSSLGIKGPLILIPLAGTPLF